MIQRPPAPIIVTFERLKQVILPKTGNLKWVEMEMHDMWLKGAPIPQQNPNAPEARVLIPLHFATWWTSVQQKLGLSNHQGQIYANIQQAQNRARAAASYARLNRNRK